MKSNEGGGRGVPPHWHTLCMNIWSFNFIQVWHGLTQKNNEGGGRGVPHPWHTYERRILWEKLWIWVSHAFQILVSFLFNRWSLLHGFGILLVPGSYWLAVKRPRLLVPGKAKATRRGLMGFASFCIILFCFVPFFGGEIGGVLQCDAVTWLLESIGMIWNPIQSMSRQVETCWLFFIHVDSMGLEV